MQNSEYQTQLKNQIIQKVMAFFIKPVIGIGYVALFPIEFIIKWALKIYKKRKSYKSMLVSKLTFLLDLLDYLQESIPAQAASPAPTPTTKPSSVTKPNIATKLNTPQWNKLRDELKIKLQKFCKQLPQRSNTLFKKIKQVTIEKTIYLLELLKPLHHRFFTHLKKVITHTHKLPKRFKPSIEGIILGSPIILKRKRRGRKKTKHSPFHNAILFATGITFAVLFIFIPAQLYGWFRELPKTQLLAQKAPTRPTQILDRNGKLLYEIYVDKDYSPIALDQIPEHVIQATLATEDASFYKHIGFDIKGMVRAAKATILDDELQGASTITQQLIKNVLLTSERTMSRKLKELFLSVMVETKYSKDEILGMYLNNIPYGGSAYGIQSAAQKFFGKDAKDLNIAEAAMLAGLPSAPSIYSPLNDDPTLSKHRQKHVLTRMVKQKYITQEEADKIYEQELVYAHQSEFIRAPHFVVFVRKELEKMYGKRFVDYSGLTVTTTLDIDLHDKMQQIVYDSVNSDDFKRLNISNAATVVLDNRNAGILSLVGSHDYYEEKYGAFDVTTAYRQPGSTIKALTYALAFDKGYTPASIINDSPVAYRGTNGQVYSPVNYDGKYHGNVTLREALACSYNIPAVKLVRTLGPDNMVQLGKNFGLENWEVDGTYGLAITLGGKETRLLDLTNAYANFARSGIYKKVSPFISIKDAYGYEIYTGFDRGHDRQVIKPGVAYLMSHILSDNKARTPAFGPKSSLVIPEHTVAVKTGTTDEKRDNYTVGYTPTYTAGVWVGNNDNTPMNPYLASGLSGAAPIWNKVMHALLDGTPNEPFTVPNNIIVKVDPQCGNKMEVFVRGSRIPARLCAPKKDDDDKDKDKKDKDKKKRKKKKKKD